MNKIWMVARFEYLRRVKTKSFIISLFIPFIVIFFSALPQYLALTQDHSSKNIGVMDDGNGLMSLLTETINQSFKDKSGLPLYTLSQIDFTAENQKTLIRELLQTGVFDAIFVINQEFLKQPLTDIYFVNFGPDEIQRVQSAFNQLLLKEHLRMLGLPAEKYDYISEKVKFQEYEITENGDIAKSNPVFRYIIPFIFVFVLVLGIITSAQSLISSIIEERGNRIIEVILSSLSVRDFMGGKILGMGMLGLTQIAFYMFILLGMGNSVLPTDIQAGMITLSGIGWYLLYFLLGYFLFSSIYIAIGTLFDNERDAQQIAGFLALVMVIPLYFIPYLMEHPESALTEILTLIPLITPFFMIARIGIFGVEWYVAAGYAIYLTVFIYFVYIAASKVFRTAILMYGKRPTLPEIIRWIRL